MSSEIRFIGNQYVGNFQKKNKRGQWRKLAFFGNTGVAMEVVDILRKLGHKVNVYIKEIEYIG